MAMNWVRMSVFGRAIELKKSQTFS